MGRDATYICQKPQPKSEQSPGITLRSSLNPEPSSSDDEDEDDEVGSTHSSSMAKQPDATTQQDAQRFVAVMMSVIWLDLTLQMLNWFEETWHWYDTVMEDKGLFILCSQCHMARQGDGASTAMVLT